MLSENFEAAEAERNGIERGSENLKRRQKDREGVKEGKQVYMGSKLIPESTIKAKHGK